MQISRLTALGTDGQELRIPPGKHLEALNGEQIGHYHTVPFIFGEYHGVIVIAIRQPNRAAILARLKWVLEQDFLKKIKSKIVLLKDRTYRIRSIE